MKKQINIELSKKSLQEAKKSLQDFQKEFNEGITNSLRVATEELYNKVIQNCIQNNISHHIDAIHWEFDEENNYGRVWVDGSDERGQVIIFNEIGTGIVGSNHPHPALSWKYDFNEHGEKGWWYPTTESDPNPIKRVIYGQLRGWTKGLPSKRMFYDAFEEIKAELMYYVELELRKTAGKIY